MKIKLLNPYYESKIEVIEDSHYFEKENKKLEKEQISSIKLTQILCEEIDESINKETKIIFINPRHWAKVEIEKWMKSN